MSFRPSNPQPAEASRGAGAAWRSKPLGAYEKVDDRPPDDPNATPSYREVLHTLGPSWAAGTTGGIALRSLSKFAPPPICNGRPMHSNH